MNTNARPFVLIFCAAVVLILNAAQQHERDQYAGQLPLGTDDTDSCSPGTVHHALIPEMSPSPHHPPKPATLARSIATRYLVRAGRRRRMRVTTVETPSPNPCARQVPPPWPEGCKFGVMAVIRHNVNPP
jgi:hypothetical protein